MKDPTGILELASHAANQSDRWLLVAMLIIFIISGWWMPNYFPTQLERTRGQMDAARVEFTEYLKSANKEMLALVTKSQDVIAHNSSVIERVERKL